MNNYSQNTNANIFSPSGIQSQTIKGPRLPFGYVMIFNSYTALTAPATIGPLNYQQMQIASDSNFEVVDLVKYDTGGGNGFIEFKLNDGTLFFGTSYAGQMQGYAGINTMFGNGMFPYVFKKPFIFPSTRVITGTYADITGTGGNLYLLFMGNKIYPNDSALAGSNLIVQNTLINASPVQYPVNFYVSSPGQSYSASITITSLQNFVLQGIIIDDTANPVLLNMTFGAFGNKQLFSAAIPSRMISGTYGTDGNASNVTPQGIRTFMLPSYINLPSQSEINITIQDFLQKSDYFVNIMLIGVTYNQATGQSQQVAVPVQQTTTNHQAVNTPTSNVNVSGYGFNPVMSWGR